MRIRSIGTRLTLWYSSLLTLTFLLLAGAAYGLLAYSLSEDVDAALSGVAKVLAERARADRATFFPSEIDELLQFPRYEEYKSSVAGKGYSQPAKEKHEKKQA